MSIYIIAQRVNTLSRLTTALNWGANAIEFDVTHSHKSGLQVCQGDVGHMRRSPLDDFLDGLKTQLLGPAGLGVSLLICDLKYSQKSGIDAARVNALRREINARVLDPINAISVGNGGAGLYVYYTVSNTPVETQTLQDALNDQPLGSFEGVNFDANMPDGACDDYVTDVEAALMWRNTHRIENFIYSAGRAAPLAGLSRAKSRSPLVTRQLQTAVEHSRADGFGTYSWSYSHAQSACNDLNALGVTGVMGNMGRNFGYLAADPAGYGMTNPVLADRQTPRPF